MASKFSQTANDSNIKSTNHEIRETSKPLDAQSVAKLVARDVKEILAEKQRQVRLQQ